MSDLATLHKSVRNKYALHAATKTFTSFVRSRSGVSPELMFERLVSLVDPRQDEQYTTWLSKVAERVPLKGALYFFMCLGNWLAYFLAEIVHTFGIDLISDIGRASLRKGDSIKNVLQADAENMVSKSR